MLHVFTLISICPLEVSWYLVEEDFSNRSRVTLLTWILRAVIEVNIYIRVYKHSDKSDVIYKRRI